MIIPKGFGHRRVHKLDVYTPLYSRDTSLVRPIYLARRIEKIEGFDALQWAIDLQAHLDGGYGKFLDTSQLIKYSKLGLPPSAPIIDNGTEILRENSDEIIDAIAELVSKNVPNLEETKLPKNKNDIVPVYDDIGRIMYKVNDAEREAERLAVIAAVEEALGRGDLIVALDTHFPLGRFQESTNKQAAWESGLESDLTERAPYGYDLGRMALYVY